MREHHVYSRHLYVRVECVAGWRLRSEIRVEQGLHAKRPTYSLT
jgi:hypothetical protein